MKIAMAQILVQGGRVEENLARAAEAIAQSARGGAKFVVLPECLDAGWTHPDARKLARAVPGETSALLGRAAREAGIYVAAGITELDGGAVYNSAVLISPDGGILRKHRKILELDFARETYATGSGVELADSAWGKVGLTICADMHPEDGGWGRPLGVLGAQLIVSPCAWAVPPGYDNAKEPYGGMWLRSYSSLAQSFHIPVIGVSNVGRIEGGSWNGWDCIGCSLAVGADAKVLAKGPYGQEALLFIEIQLR